MRTINTLFVCGSLALLAACGADTDENAATAANDAAATADVEAQAAQSVATESAAEEPVLEAVEESDGSFDASAVAAEGSLRMAQNTADAAPQRFNEGTHYKRFRPAKMKVTGGDRVEVAEVFWYGCNHCYNLEPMIARWKKDLPENVEFVKMPAVWNPSVETHAQVFYTIEALAGAGVIENKQAVHMGFFDKIHVDRQRMTSEKSISDFLATFGVSEEQFESTWTSFEVNTKMRQAKTLNRSYNIASVPTIVVNGKYVTDETMAGGKAELFAVIDELVASER